MTENVMTEVQNPTYWDWFWFVVVMWHMTGFMGWIAATIIKACFGVPSIWGEKLNFLDCMNKGPMAGFYAFMVLGCPEFVDKMNRQCNDRDDSGDR